MDVTEAQENEAIINTMAQQINVAELKLAKFRIYKSVERTSLILIKGQKIMRISYNHGTDMYDIEKSSIRGTRVTRTEEEGLYFDMLRDEIERFFPSFEYVMDGIITSI